MLFFSSCVILLFIKICKCQFPGDCVQNATLQNARCCPIPEGFTEPCGGAARGRCVALPNVDEVAFPPIPARFANDDRLNWPHRFFQYGCHCNNNFFGYKCQFCKPGLTGKNCLTRKTFTRKNILSLSSREKTIFRNVLNISKYKPSEWMILNVSSNLNADPVKNLEFYNTTVYDFFVYQHVYTARSTLTPDLTNCSSTSPFNHIDFAHEGAGFLTWHRYHLQNVEKELQIIALDNFNSTNFALPYWDFRDVTYNDVSRNDLLGRENKSDPNSRLDSSALFYDWQHMCPFMEDFGLGCRRCDPTKTYYPISRGFGRKTIEKQMPTTAFVNWVLSRRQFDSENYNKYSSNVGFRNAIEGFANQTGWNYTDVAFMHNLGHGIIGGSMNDQVVSPNDPIFLVYHAFLDKLFEIWLRRNRPSINELPAQGAPTGHNRESPMVPFFPPVAHYMMFTDSRTLGYDYTDMSLTDSKETENKLQPAIIAVIGQGLGLLLLVFVVVCILRHKRRQKIKYMSPLTITPGETTDSEDGWIDARMPLMEEVPKSNSSRTSSTTRAEKTYGTLPRRSDPIPSTSDAPREGDHIPSTSASASTTSVKNEKPRSRSNPAFPDLTIVTPKGSHIPLGNNDAYKS